MIDLLGNSEDSEVEYIQQLVSEIPAPILEALAQKWYGNKLKLTEDNKAQKFGAPLKDIPRSWKIQLERLRRITGINQITWAPYLIDNTTSTFAPDKFTKPVKFSTDDLISTDIAVQGFLHVNALPGENFILTLEFRSRSNKYRSAYHYLLIPKHNLLFVEAKPNCLHFFEEIWNNILSLTLKPILIRPVDIRKLVNSLTPDRRSDISKGKINLLQITLSQVISGFKGLTGITFQGENILEGMVGMKVRHDLSIDFSDLGPWTEVRTDHLHLIVGKGILIKNYDGISKAITLLSDLKPSKK